MPTFIDYSNYQMDIFDRVVNTTESLRISAVAGSGKTTTIVDCLKLMPDNSTNVFLALNNFIVDSLKERIEKKKNILISTVHSLGWQSVIVKYYRKKPKMDKNKLIGKIERYCNSNGIDPKRKGYYFYMISKIVNLMKLSLVTDIKEAEELCLKHDIFFFDNELEIAFKVLEESIKDTKCFDFTDMIYFPATHDEIQMRKFDNIFIDESQDLSPAAHAIIKKIMHKDSRLIAVGDPHQCQPDGTKVYLEGGVIKNIENVLIGDKVITYDNNGCFKGWNKNNKQSIGQKVLDVNRRKFIGEILNVKVGTFSSEYTLNHRCVVRFDKAKIENSYVLYLMQRGQSDFRIGIAKNKRKDGFGVHVRFKAEKADKMWILDIYDSREKAIFFEQFYSCKFGLPQLCFTEPRIKTDKGTFNSNEMFDVFYEELRPVLLSRGIKCLKYFGRDIMNPLLKKGEKNRLSCFGFFETFASNLMSGFMQMKIFKGDNQGEWVNIGEIKTKKYNGYVVSLKVEKYERYVADGILTHNSIYGFAGADINSYNNLSLITKMVDMPLSVCYRCAENIVIEAQTLVSHIEIADGADEGMIQREGSLKDLRYGDWILCRNVAPLVTLCLYLIKNDVKAKIRGKDIGQAIISLINSSKANSIGSLHSFFEYQLAKMKTSLAGKGVWKPEDHPKYVYLQQQIDVIKALSEGVTGIFQLFKRIEDIFTDEIKGILLSTIHKSKGLENDRILFLAPELIPNKHARQEWQLQQEYNLKYVAITRAKKELIYIPDNTFKQNILFPISIPKPKV